MDYGALLLALLAVVAFIAYRINQAADYLLAANKLRLDSTAERTSQRIVDLLTEQNKLLARIAEGQQIK